MNPGAPLRLAFTHIPRRLWAGGYNYQSNLFAALSKFRPGEFTPVLFAGTGDDDADLAPLAAIPGVEVVRSAGVRRAVRVWLRRWRWGLTVRRRRNSGRSASMPSSKAHAASLAGVCLILQWPGFPIFSIDGCLSFFRRQRGGVAKPASECRSRPGGPSC